MTDGYVPLLFGTFIDGFNPFNSGTYSIWAMLEILFNLPPEVRQIRCFTVGGGFITEKARMLICMV